jgi:ABC-type amino acid transport substrate-binding protein
MRNLKNIVSLTIVLLPFMVIGLGIWLISGFKSDKHGPDAPGYIIGMMKGTGYEELIRSFPQATSIKVFQNDRRMWDALQNKKVDLVVNDRLKSLDVIKNEDFNKLIFAGKLIRRDVKVVAFTPGDGALRQAINRGIREIIVNGVFEGISERYFSGNILQEIQHENLYVEEPEASDNSWDRVKRLDTIIFALDPNNPPFSYLDDNQQWSGFEVDIAWAVCIQLGIKNFCPVPVTKEQIIPGFQAKLFDAVWGVIQPTDAVHQKAIFSIPYCVTGPQLITRKDSGISGPEVLARPIVPGQPEDSRFDENKDQTSI